LVLVVDAPRRGRGWQSAVRRIRSRTVPSVRPPRPPQPSASESRQRQGSAATTHGGVSTASPLCCPLRLLAVRRLWERDANDDDDGDDDDKDDDNDDNEEGEAALRPRPGCCATTGGADAEAGRRGVRVRRADHYCSSSRAPFGRGRPF